jgi:nucleotide-binding universal stress UspA family protein
MNKTTYNILVPIDFSEQSLFALEQAIGIAKAVEGNLNLLYIHHDKKGVLSKLFSDDQAALFDKAVEEKLLQLAREKSTSHGIKIDFELAHATSVATKIINVSEEKKSAMIVMGKGRLCDEGMEMLIIGSVTSRVIRYSKIPVISVGHKVSNSQCKNILLPLDLTKETRQKVSWGIQMARIFNAKIKVVSVLWEKNNAAVVKPLVAQMKQVTGFIRKAGVEVDAKIIESDKGSASLVPLLTKYIEEEDINLALIMTQQENDISQFFLGSTATEFIRKSPVPVMSITPRETGEIIWGF